MEIGFVKQALNNEIIRMKPLFRRAKVQTFNKLNKKSKLFKAKLEKCDEKGVLKFSNKSKELLKEAFIIKKLKARDCAEFVLRNNKNIQHFLNSSEATREKALCRLITHKSLVDKIVFIKEKFLNMPVDVLLAPGKRQIFKEDKEKRKLQKKGKRMPEWTITDSPKSEDKKADDSLQNGDKPVMETNKPEAEPSVSNSSNSTPAQPKKKRQLKESKPTTKKLKKKLPESKEEIIPEVSGIDSFFITNDGDNYKMLVEKRVQEPIPESKVVRGNLQNSPKSEDIKADDSLQNGDKPIMEMNKPVVQSSFSKSSNSTPAQPKKKRQPKESKPTMKKLKKKLLELKEEIIPEVSGVDSFFMTNDGDNYKTLVEKRVQEPIPESKVVRGNRKARRAVMFGRPLPFQPTQNSSKSERSFDKLEKNSKNWDNLPKIFDKDTISKKSRLIIKGDSTKSIKEDISSLHPSWQAKKQQSVISEFKGKKVVFDDD